MAGIFQADGLEAACNALADLAHDGGGAAEWVVHLYKNNFTPLEGSVLGSFTEADFSGYAPLPIGAFGAAVYAFGRATALGVAPLTWTNTTGAVGNDVYGVFVTNAAGTVLQFAERAPAAPIDMQTAAQVMSYTPSLYQRNV